MALTWLLAIIHSGSSVVYCLQVVRKSLREGTGPGGGNGSGGRHHGVQATHIGGGDLEKKLAS